jgi:hypothetical protein
MWSLILKVVPLACQQGLQQISELMYRTVGEGEWAYAYTVSRDWDSLATRVWNHVWTRVESLGLP